METGRENDAPSAPSRGHIERYKAALERLRQHPERPLSDQQLEALALEKACEEERENILQSVVATAERAQVSADPLEMARLQVLSTCLMVRAMLLRERTAETTINVDCQS